MREIRNFRRWLLGVTALAFAVRVTYALAVAADFELHGDAFLYRALAWELTNGHGYSQLDSVFAGDPEPTAQHPPLFAFYLAAWSELGLDSLTAHRVVTCLMGAAAVALIGLLGRRVAGARVGLIAAGIAAVYPPLFMIDGALLSESLYAPLIVASLLLAYRFLDRPSPLRAAALGVAIGLATLTRSEGILLLVLVAAPVVWRAGQGRLPAFAACAAATALVISPWLVRNWVEFDEFPVLSTNGGGTAQATNCDAVYYTDLIGFASHGCVRESCNRLTGEVAQDNCRARRARSYARDNLERVPLVVLARVERVWEVYDPETNLDYSRQWARARGAATAGLVLYTLLVPLALGGAFLLRGRSVSLLPLLATFAMATVVAAIAFGFSRYRLVAEPALVVLAAVGIERLFQAASRRVRRSRARRRRALRAGRPRPSRPVPS